MLPLENRQSHTDAQPRTRHKISAVPSGYKHSAWGMVRWHEQQEDRDHAGPATVVDEAGVVPLEDTTQNTSSTGI